MKFDLRWLGLIALLVPTPARPCESELARLLGEVKTHDLRAGFAYPIGYEVTIAPDEARRIEGRAALLVTHASAAWDKSESTSEAVRTAVDFARSRAMTTVGLVSRIDLGAAQFYGPGDLDHVAGSDGGAHRLDLAEAKTVYFAGGQLSLCLGETIRETLRSRSVRRLVLVADAIFDFERAIFRPYRLVDLDEKRAAHLLKKLLSGGRSVFGTQLSTGYRLLNSAPFTFEVYGKDREVEATIGQGPRRIEVWISAADRLEEIKDWIAE